MTFPICKENSTLLCTPTQSTSRQYVTQRSLLLCQSIQRSSLQCVTQRSLLTPDIVCTHAQASATFAAAWRRTPACVAAAERQAHAEQMRDAEETPCTERVTFRDSIGNDLIGILTLPDASHAVLLCHGYTSSKDGMHGGLPALAERLASDGVASIRFDFAGNGESTGEFRFANYAAEVDQMEAAVQYLQSRGKRVCGLLGHSKGGTEVIQYAARHESDDKDLRIVNICGRCHLKTGIDRRFDAETLAQLEREGSLQLPHPRTGQLFTLTNEELQERMTFDMVAAAKKIVNTKVLTIHGSADDTVPMADAEEFDRHISHHTLEVLEGANHNFTEHQAAVVRLAADFLLSGIPFASRQ